jgi:hypothetical protein
MSESPNLGLPFIEAAQAQKHVTHNEAISVLDAVVQASVSDVNAIAPPLTPANGSRVIVASSATGVFAERAAQIACFDAGAWRFISPHVGWLVWSTPDEMLFVFTSDGWVKFTDALDAIENLDRLGVGTGADAVNPLSVRAAGALFTARYAADGGDGTLRLTLNKETAAGTVSHIYQTNWSGRAETGLIGNDLWSVRRSSDGATWTTPLIVDTSQVRVIDGSAGNPGIAFMSAATTGFARLADGSLCAAVGGVELWRAAASGVFSIPGSAIIGDNSGARGRLTIGVGLTHGLYFGLRGSLGAFADGVFTLRDNAGSGFGRLQFGGATSGFPALKRSSAVLQARLADDSNFTGLECSFVRPLSYTVATVPSASAVGAGATIYVSNESGGAVLAFSDGASWRRVTDRAVIS